MRAWRVLMLCVFASVLTLPAWTKTLPPPPDKRQRIDAAKLPLPAGADQVPWSAAVDGMQCRLLIEPAVTHGEPIRAVLQFRNNSKKTRYIWRHVDFRLTDQSRLGIVAPDGKKLVQNGSSRTSIVPSQFEPIKPGVVRRFDVLDIRGLFVQWKTARNGRARPVDGMQQDGEYKLSYTYISPAMPKRFVSGQRAEFKNGKQVIIKDYTDTSKEMLAAAWQGTLTAAPVSMKMRPMTTSDLTVHEWGVFTVFAGAEQANVNRQEEWASLPADFYRQFPQRRLRWVPAAWDKPIVYFYSDLPSLEIDVSVRFADGGAPVVWWPCASEPIDDGIGRGRMVVPAKKVQAKTYFDHLRWTGWLGDIAPSHVASFGGQQAWVKVEEFKLPEKTWLREARLPKARPFTVSGATLQRSSPWNSQRPETERFIYYDGLVPAPDHLQCLRVTAESVTLKNTARFPIGPIFLIDRRDAKNTGWALRADKIAAGAEATIAFTKFDGESPTKLVTAVRQSLLKAGLFPEEADSLLKIWRKKFFEAEGLTALHLLPGAEYDRMLPLSVTPKPAQAPVRVGIAYHPHIEMQPELTVKTAQLIRDLDSEQFPVREAATRTLEKMGPWAIPFIEKALKAAPSLETRRRLERVLNKADAAAWLRGAEKEASLQKLIQERR